MLERKRRLCEKWKLVYRLRSRYITIKTMFLVRVGPTDCLDGVEDSSDDEAIEAHNITTYTIMDIYHRREKAQQQDSSNNNMPTHLASDRELQAASTKHACGLGPVAVCSE